MMKNHPTIPIVAVLAVITGSIAAGCGESATTPRPGDGASSSSSSGDGGMAGGGGGAGGNAGGMGGLGGMGGAGGSGAEGGLGNITIVDVAEAPCADLVGTTVQLYPENSVAPAFNMLAKVGAKRLAGGRYAPGFVTFGVDGSSPSPSIVGLDPDSNLVASEGTTIGLATAASSTIRFQRYASDDSPIGGPLELGSALGAGLAIAGDMAGGSLVVWASPTTMNGRFVDSSGNPGTAFTFADGISTKAIATSLTRSGQEFAIAWSTVDATAVARARFARLSKSGLIGSVVELTGDAYSHYVVKLMATPSGHALLVNAGAMVLEPIVILLDFEGKVIGSARRFLGMQFGWDIASSGDNLGLVAKRADGFGAFRLLDVSAAPMGAWKCLDGPSEDSFDQAGIDSDAAGWAIVYRTPLGGEKFVRTNLDGTAGL